MNIALLGNQNCGKTTLFNRLTGNNAHAGNYPGITVEVMEGTITGTDMRLADLPGIYSLSCVTQEERVAKNYLLKEKPELIINILDASAIQRGLYLTMQLLEFDIPVIAVLNMMDQVEKEGGRIDCTGLSRMLGIPVLPISARSGKNVDRLLTALQAPPKKKKTPFALPAAMRTSPEETASFYYGHIDTLCKKNVFLKKRPKISPADRLLTGRFTAFPMFLLIMAAVLFITFSFLGQAAANGIESFVDFTSGQLEALLGKLNTSPFLTALICDGILNGVGSVLSFLPCVLILFFFLALLEDSGYMARVAFIMDTPMRRCGFSGKAVVPLIMGLGCSVPALLSCRTLEANRRSTALAVPFISCSARLPVYLMLSSLFFRQPFFILVLLYASGLGAALMMGFLSKQKNEPPFLLELPPYRLPKLSTVIKDMLDKAADFLKRAFTIIFAASTVTWLLANLDFSLQYTTENSILYHIAQAMLPLFVPLGFSCWQLCAALLAGISAKEAVISTMSVLGVTGAAFTPASALSFLFFCALYTPCVASISILFKEYGAKTAFLSVAMQTLTAYAVSFIVYTAACLVL